MDTNKLKRRKFSRGFSLVELLVVIAVIVILIALLLPAVGMVRGKSRQSQCVSNQRQIWAAWSRAMSRDPAHPVRATNWTTRIAPYREGGEAVVFCPDDVPPMAESSYGMNAHAWRLSAPDAGRIVLLDYGKTVAQVVDQTFAQLDAAWPVDRAPRHFLTANVLFYDGHAEPREPRHIDPRYCVYFERYWRPVMDSRITLADCRPGDPTAASTMPGGTTTTTTTGETTTGGITTGGTTTGGSTTGGTTTGGPPPCVTGRKVRISRPTASHLSITEVQVFDLNNNNVALNKSATQGAATYNAYTSASKAVDGNASSSGYVASNANSISITKDTGPPWWEVDLGSDVTIARIVLWARTESYGYQLSDCTLEILDASGTAVWTQNTSNMHHVRSTSFTICGSIPSTNDNYNPPDPCLASTPTTTAIKGLNWLARHQWADGSWSFQFQSHPNCSGQCLNNGNVPARAVATGLALMGLIASGSTATKGPYANNICLASQYLLARVDDQGRIQDADWTDNRVMYGQLIASLALSEVLRSGEAAYTNGCGEQPCALDLTLLRQKLQLMADYAGANQSTPGGWNYFPASDVTDSTESSWGFMFLGNCKILGLNVPPAVINRLHRALDAVERNPVMDFSYNVRLGDYTYKNDTTFRGNVQTPVGTTMKDTAMTAAGLTNRILLGAPIQHTKIQGFAALLAPRTGNFYYNLHAAHLLHLVRGTAWSNWKANALIHFDGLQDKSEGHQDGSWQVSGSAAQLPRYEDGFYGNDSSGRHYCTCFALLSMGQAHENLSLGGAGGN